MASIYPRAGSRFYWLKYRSPEGKTKCMSTGIDKELPNARQRAKAMAAEYTVDEMTNPKGREVEKWENWAGEYFEHRYAGTGSHKNATVTLRDLTTFFKEKRIRTPRMLTYHLAAQFVPWRVSNKDLKKVKLNTANLRFAYFRILMAEAVRRGFAKFNPCRDVDIRGEPPKQKKEITPADEKTICAALQSEPEWMRDQWLVMMRQGCRIAETRCQLSRINTKAMTITFRVKGGRFHTAALHKDLLPLIEKAKAAGRDVLAEGGRNSPARWCDFFDKLKMEYSAHCCRVTVITRLLRAGHTTALVSSFIGHTEEINRIYRRLKPSDATALLTTLGDDSSPSTGNDAP
jgi:hypothetical protein